MPFSFHSVTVALISGQYLSILNIRHAINNSTIYNRHEAHYHQQLFLEAWMSVKDPNAGNDHMVLPEV